MRNSVSYIVITFAVLLFLLTFLGFSYGLFFIGNYLNHKQCRNNVEEMGLGYRYDWTNGCRIEYEPGVYIYWKMYKIERQ